MATGNDPGQPGGQQATERPAEIAYPSERSGRPHVIVVGGGVSGMTAAHRLLERGHDVTLLEADSFLGGMLGAHREEDELPEGAELPPEATAAFGWSRCKHCTDPCCKDARKRDWHEHCYHMYLNWYHNFWGLMRDIGILDRFQPMNQINYLRPDPDAPVVRADNPGSPWTAMQNMTSGLGTPADLFLHGQAMLDLLATPARVDHRLDQISVGAFLREHPYTTDQSRMVSHQVLAKAFAAPSALASAATYKSFLKYGARLPEPTMWLLKGNTGESIFIPWLNKLKDLSGHFTIKPSHPDQPFPRSFGKLALAPLRTQEEMERRPAFTILPLTALTGLEIDPSTGEFLLRVQPMDRSPTVQEAPDEDASPFAPQLWRFGGQVVLAVPARQLARIVFRGARDTRADYAACIAAADPALANATRLKGAPIMSLDVFFRRPLRRPLPRGIVILLESRYEMSVYDNTQMWDADAPGEAGPHMISVCASDADPLMPFVDREGGAQVIVDLLLQELQRYIDFDREADILQCRTHLQTNAGEELFINAVNTWNYRPKTTTAIQDLFIAGDYVQTPIDVVTIEAAATSGLMAAEAVRRRTGQGRPVPIAVPDSTPVAMMAAVAGASRPYAYVAKMMSKTDQSLRRTYSELFPGS